MPGVASSEPALLSAPPIPVAPVPRPRHVPAVWALGLLALANAVVIVALWWRAGGAEELTGTASTLTSLGRLSGLGGAALALVQVLLVARLPVLDRLVGLDRLTRWHRVCGAACLTLLLAHAAMITTGYALADRLGIVAELSRMIGAYPGVITAIAGLTLLVGVSVSSVIVVRRRLRYETWYFVHLYAYLAIALAFSHQIATGRDFVGDPLARAYWIGLYVATLGAVLAFRIALPLVRSWKHRLRVERVVAEGPGVVSLDIGGVGLEQLRAKPGQFFSWRFLTRDRWWEAHPFSLSAAPDGRRLRITVKELGDYTAWLRSVRPGTRILAEGPYGAFTSAARRRPRVVLIAGGLGITPVRALLEEMPGGPGTSRCSTGPRTPTTCSSGPSSTSWPSSAAPTCTTSWATGGSPARATRCRPSTSPGSCRTSPTATSTCAARRG